MTDLPAALRQAGITDPLFSNDSRIFSRKLLLVACLENFSESKMGAVIFNPSLSLTQCARRSLKRGGRRSRTRDRNCSVGQGFTPCTKEQWIARCRGSVCNATPLPAWPQENKPFLKKTSEKLVSMGNNSYNKEFRPQYYFNIKQFNASINHRTFNYQTR